ncbi:MAG: hypothetical protein MH204_01500, partial [Fimbriimonadaceae bacterium]|nr:hypothetical protein [Fimbriimonadaceae bacterium]
ARLTVPQVLRFQQGEMEYGGFNLQEADEELTAGLAAIEKLREKGLGSAEIDQFAEDMESARRAIREAGSEA